MGAPVGNTNARRAREFRDMLRRRLDTYENEKQGVARGEALAAICDTLIKLGIGGDLNAIRETANRTDGKPTQVSEIDVRVDVRQVLLTLKAKAGDAGAREALQAMGAQNLIPLLDQLDRPALEYET